MVSTQTQLCGSRPVAAPTVSSCSPQKNSVRRQWAPGSTQQHTDLRPKTLPQNCKILIGSPLWPPGVCVHVPGASGGPRLLSSDSVSHTVCPPNIQLCSENLSPAFKREMVQNSEVCFSRSWHALLAPFLSPACVVHESSYGPAFCTV